MHRWSIAFRDCALPVCVALALTLPSLPAGAGDRSRTIPDIQGLRVMLDRHDRPVARILGDPGSERGRFMTSLPKSGSAGLGSASAGLLSIAAPHAGGEVPRADDAMLETEKYTIALRAMETATRLREAMLGGAAARHRDYCTAAADRAAMEATVNGYKRSSSSLFTQADAVCAEALRVADETVFRRKPIALPER